jgi:hypothetical protein
MENDAEKVIFFQAVADFDRQPAVLAHAEAGARRQAPRFRGGEMGQAAVFVYGDSGDGRRSCVSERPAACVLWFV